MELGILYLLFCNRLLSRIRGALLQGPYSKGHRLSVLGSLYLRKLPIIGGMDLYTNPGSAANNKL